MANDTSELKKLVLICRTAIGGGADSDPSKRAVLQVTPTRPDSHTEDLDFPDITGNEFEQGISGIYEFELPANKGFLSGKLSPRIEFDSTDGWIPDFIVLLSQNKKDEVVVERHDLTWSSENVFRNDTDANKVRKLGGATEKKEPRNPKLKKLVLITRTAKGGGADSDPSKRPILQIVPSTEGGHTEDLEFPDITGNELEQGYSGIYEFELPDGKEFRSGELNPRIEFDSGDGWIPDFIVLLSQTESGDVRVETHDLLWQGMFRNDTDENKIHYLGGFYVGD